MSINFLEFVVISLSCNAVLDSFEMLHQCSGVLQPKALILSDDIAVDSHTRKIASSSVVGESLCRILQSLLINQVAGLDSDCISGKEKEHADSAFLT